MNVLGEASTRGLEAGGAADAFIRGTLGEGLFSAVVAVPAGNVMEDHHAVVDREVLNAFANGGQGPGGLMAEDAWGRVRAAVNLFEIRATDAAGGDVDENFAGSDGWDRDGFDADVIDAPVNRSAHGCGNPGLSDFSVGGVSSSHLLL